MRKLGDGVLLGQIRDHLYLGDRMGRVAETIFLEPNTWNRLAAVERDAATLNEVPATLYGISAVAWAHVPPELFWVDWRRR